MFSGILIQIEPSLVSNFSFSFIMIFGYLLNRSKKILFSLSISLGIYLITTNITWALAAAPGGGTCGSVCISQQRLYNQQYQTPYPWPGAYYYPRYNVPWLSPNYYQRFSPYPGYGQCFNCNTYNRIPTNQRNSVLGL
jgi:hypothetical protein